MENLRNLLAGLKIQPRKMGLKLDRAYLEKMTDLICNKYQRCDTLIDYYNPPEYACIPFSQWVWGID